LVKEAERLRQSLREAALVDYRRVDFHGEKVLPAELGRRIANEREQHAWIPGPASESETCPVRDEDVKKLYRINAQLTDEDKALLAGPLPSLDQLPTPRADRQARTAHRPAGPVDPVFAARAGPDPHPARDHPAHEVAEALQEAHLAAPPGVEPTDAGRPDGSG